MSARLEVERRYLVQRMWMRSEFTGLTGRSSDEMVLCAFTGETPCIYRYPLDRGAWRRCLLAYALAPEWLREQMRPTMRAYRAGMDRRYWHWSSFKTPRGDFISGFTGVHA